VWSLVGVHLSANFRAALHGDLAAPVFVVGVARPPSASCSTSRARAAPSGLQVVRTWSRPASVPAGDGTRGGRRALVVGLLVAWTVPLVVAPPLLWQLLRLPRARHPRPDDRVRAHLRRYRVAALHNHSLSLSLQASALLVPMLAAGPCPRSRTAFQPGLAGGDVRVHPAVHARHRAVRGVGQRTIDTFRASMRRTLPVGLAISAGCYLGVLLLGDIAMRAFGREYAAAGSHILRIVAIGGLALVVKDHFFAIYRCDAGWPPRRASPSWASG